MTSLKVMKTVFPLNQNSKECLHRINYVFSFLSGESMQFPQILEEPRGTLSFGSTCVGYGGGGVTRKIIFRPPKVKKITELLLEVKDQSDSEQIYDVFLNFAKSLLTKKLTTTELIYQFLKSTFSKQISEKKWIQRC